MDQEQTPIGLQLGNDFETDNSHPNNLEVVVLAHETAVSQPRAVGHGECFFVIAKRNAARIFVVARATVNRRLYLTDESQRFIGEAPLLDQIAGETDKF